MRVGVHEAKTTLSRLLARVEAGEEVVIERSGRPVARLVPIDSAPRQRRPGSWAGKVRIGADFDDPLPPHRALVAQARAEGPRLVTADQALSAYDVRRLDAQR